MPHADEPAVRAAAFGDDPAVDDLTLARACFGPPRLRWLAAVVLGGRGDYARATAALEPLIAGPDPVLASLAASALASHRRQLGGHADARRWDSYGLNLAVRAAAGRRTDTEVRDDPDGADLAGALADALLGLTADALACGRQTEARRLLGRLATGSLAGVAVGEGWRTRVRQGWVTAEVELAAGNPGAAVAPAERAWEISRARGARRHVVKSAIVLAVARLAEGHPAGRGPAEQLIIQACDDAARYGIDSLRWPAALVARDLDEAGARRHEAEMMSVLHGVLRRSDPRGRSLALLSPWVPVKVL